MLLKLAKWQGPFPHRWRWSSSNYKLEPTSNKSLGHGTISIITTCKLTYFSSSVLYLLEKRFISHVNRPGALRTVWMLYVWGTKCINSFATLSNARLHHWSMWGAIICISLMVKYVFLWFCTKYFSNCDVICMRHKVH